MFKFRCEKCGSTRVVADKDLRWGYMFLSCSGCGWQLHGEDKIKEAVLRQKLQDSNHREEAEKEAAGSAIEALCAGFSEWRRKALSTAGHSIRKFCTGFSAWQMKRARWEAQARIFGKILEEISYNYSYWRGEQERALGRTLEALGNDFAEWVAATPTCAWKDCGDPPRASSKYCSRGCSNRNARARHKARSRAA